MSLCVAASIFCRDRSHNPVFSSASHDISDITLSRALLSGNGLSLSLAGSIAEFIYNGTIAIDAASINGGA